VAWRYLAQRLTGDGLGEFIGEIPLRNVGITDVLSGPIGLTGNVSPAVATLKGDDGRPLLDEWGTAVWAEESNLIRGGGILTHRAMSGPDLALEFSGFTAYPKDMPFTDSWFGVEVDPLDVVRLIWAHLQGKPRGNLGLQLDQRKTGLKIGVELEQVEFDTESGPVSFEAGPVKLAWYQTDDLGGEIDKFAQQTPFDYHERHQWAANGSTQLEHFLDFGYPRLGNRRADLRFVLGENIGVVPSLTGNGADYANETLALGAGEGRTMLRGGAAVNDGKLRRVATVVDKKARSLRDVNANAKRELAWRSTFGEDITEIVVRDHQHAPLGSWGVGDEIRVQAETDWTDFDQWARVLSSTISPESGEAATLTIARVDKVTA
jgi:hypothetical protein